MDEYVRYGEEWKQEMMRNKKEDIVRMFSEAMKEKEEYAEQVCKEQKEICCRTMRKTLVDNGRTVHGPTHDAILKCKLATDK